MPELNLQVKVLQKPDIAYGSYFLSNEFKVEDTCIGGAWPPFQKFRTDRNLNIYIMPNQKTLIKDWPENEDPFTQADLLNNEEDQVQELIFQIRKSLSIRYHESLANRLLILFNDAKEEDSASLGIAVGSLRNFYNFFRLHTNLKCPTMSLTPDYNIYASWRGEQNRVFSVHFLPNGDARFVIFKPNDRHPGRQIRLSGIATTDVLMKTVAPNSVSYWISE
jgi:hypothetical protein